MKRRRKGNDEFADVGELRNALAVCAVDRPVKIRLPDGRKFAASSRAFLLP